MFGREWRCFKKWKAAFVIDGALTGYLRSIVEAPEVLTSLTAGSPVYEKWEAPLNSTTSSVPLTFKAVLLAPLRSMLALTTSKSDSSRLLAPDPLMETPWADPERDTLLAPDNLKSPLPISMLPSRKLAPDNRTLRSSAE